MVDEHDAEQSALAGNAKLIEGVVATYPEERVFLEMAAMARANYAFGFVHDELEASPALWGAPLRLSLLTPADWWASVANLVWPLMGLWLVTYFFAESGSLGANLQRSLYLAAHTDALTGLPNLRHFTSMSDLRAKLAKPYTIVMVDADYLKRVNDTSGHAAGNDDLRAGAGFHAESPARAD